MPTRRTGYGRGEVGDDDGRRVHSAALRDVGTDVALDKIAVEHHVIGAGELGRLPFPAPPVVLRTSIAVRGVGLARAVKVLSKTNLTKSLQE
jgi:hypothetical protein